MKPSLFPLLGCTLFLAGNTVFGQQAGDAVRLEYGTIPGQDATTSEGKRAGGTVVGGVAGAAIADDRPGLGGSGGSDIALAIPKLPK